MQANFTILWKKHSRSSRQCAFYSLSQKHRQKAVGFCSTWKQARRFFWARTDTEKTQVRS